MTYQSLQTLLELINGVWGILAMALAVVTGRYLYQEGISRRIGWRGWVVYVPLGMRVATAIFTIAAGVALTRGTIWYWRVIFGAGPFTKIMLAVLLIGTVVGATGFLCAIREISKPIYGNIPWMAALVVAVIFIVISLWIR